MVGSKTIMAGVEFILRIEEGIQALLNDLFERRYTGVTE